MKVIALFVVLLLFGKGSAQTNVSADTLKLAYWQEYANPEEIKKRGDIFINNLNSLYQDPEQTIKTANYLLGNAASNTEKAKALYLRSKSKMLKGNIEEGIEDLFEAKEILREDESPFISSLVLTAISEQCRMSGMDDVAAAYFHKAESFSKKIDSEQEKTIALTMIFQEQAKRMAQKNNTEKAIHHLKKAERLLKNISPALAAITQNELGNNYLKIQKNDSSEFCFNKAISLLKSVGLNNSSIESVSLNGLGNTSVLKGDLKNASHYLTEALKVPIIDISTKIKILDHLSTVYKNLDSNALSQKYYNEKVALDASVLYSEREVRRTIISHIDTEQKKTLLSDERDYYQWGIVFIALFLLILIGYYFYNRKLDNEYLRFQKIIAQIEKEEKLETLLDRDDSLIKTSKSMVIPEETEKNILERLQEFEASTKFTNNNMNLNLLAKQLKTNSKYVSEIIRVHKQKNFNTYINELRVNYIIHLMKTDKAYLTYKVSYLAETCGFSSHSAFTVVFKSITGFTPKQFIAFLEKSKKENSTTF